MENNRSALNAHSIKDRSLLGSRLLAVALSASRIGKFLAGSFCSDVSAKMGRIMPFGQMLSRGYPFQIRGSVVAFDAVDVMNMGCAFRMFAPARGYNAMHEAHSAERGVSIVSNGRRVRRHFSECLPAGGNGVNVVEASVLDAVHVNADHAQVYHQHQGMYKWPILS